MRKFDNPLENVHIASPCRAVWEQMYGDDRQRYCPECKLNVFNLSGMARREAENLLLNTEGRLCVRFFRRSDGTILTKDCPVGWRAIKRRIRKAATALASFILGILAGTFVIRVAEKTLSLLPIGDVPAVKVGDDFKYSMPIVGEAVIISEAKGQGSTRQPKNDLMLGRVEPVQKLSDEKVVAWVK